MERKILMISVLMVRTFYLFHSIHQCPYLETMLFFDSSAFVDIFKGELFRLIDAVIEARADLDVLLKAMGVYASYSASPKIFHIINDAIDYMGRRPDLLLVPRGMRRLYSALIAVTPDNFQVIETSVPRVDRIEQFINSNYKILDDIFEMRRVVPVNGLLAFTGFTSSDGGIPGYLFVDEDLLHKENWIESVMQSTYTILTMKNPIANLGIEDEIAITFG